MPDSSHSVNWSRRVIRLLSPNSMVLSVRVYRLVSQLHLNSIDVGTDFLSTPSLGCAVLGKEVETISDTRQLASI